MLLDYMITLSIGTNKKEKANANLPKPPPIPRRFCPHRRSSALVDVHRDRLHARQ
jgi:hypothetical protein